MSGVPDGLKSFARNQARAAIAEGRQRLACSTKHTETGGVVTWVSHCARCNLNATHATLLEYERWAVGHVCHASTAHSAAVASSHPQTVNSRPTDPETLTEGNA